MAYAIWKTDGMELLQQQGIDKEKVLIAIRDGKLGDVDVHREFSTVVGAKKKKGHVPSDEQQ
jgi:hypothetical protein